MTEPSAQPEAPAAPPPSRRHKRNSRAAVRVDRQRSESVGSVLLLAGFSLIAAHLSVKALFPNPLFWLIGAGAIGAMGVWWCVGRRDEFGFFLAMFVCAHFDIADNQGGLWAYIVCAVFLGARLLGSPSGIALSNIPAVTKALLGVFVASQLLGTARNPFSLVSNIQATLVLCAQVIVLCYCASQPMTAARLRRLISTWGLVALWMFVTGLNQRYQWIITPSPVLPQRSMIDPGLPGAAPVFGSTPCGTFGTSELFAEYFSIMFALLLVFLGHPKAVAELRINKFVAVLVFIACIAAVTMGGSRSAVIWIAAVLGGILLVNVGGALAGGTPQKLFIYLSLLLLGIIFVLALRNFLFAESMIQDFRNLDLSKLNTEGVISGEGINRDTVYEAGYRRLGQASWWLGYGYNLPENNRWSMGISLERIADFHNLYLCLPIYYGWIGAAAYVLLVLGAALRSLSSYQRTRSLDHVLVPFALGFTLLWGIFLVDQWKITATRRPCYFLMTWFWLGWTHSVVTTLRGAVPRMKIGKAKSRNLPNAEGGG